MRVGILWNKYMERTMPLFPPEQEVYSNIYNINSLFQKAGFFYNI